MCIVNHKYNRRSTMKNARPRFEKQKYGTNYTFFMFVLEILYIYILK